MTRKRQTGQAMTELQIAAAFVLVPLFLCIPLLAKYIDMRHATIQAARYEAWEYTVWYARDCDRNIFAKLAGADEECPMGGFDEAQQPFKTVAQTRAEARRRFFTHYGDTDPVNDDPSVGVIGISDTDKTTGWTALDSNYLWRDHTGNPLYNGAIGAGEDLQSSDDTPTVPVIGDVLNVLVDVIGVVFGAIADLLGVFGSSVGFDAINTDGYANSTVVAPSVNPPNYDQSSLLGDTFPGAGGPITFAATAGVLTDGWNSGGVEQTYNQAGGTVPTVILKELLTLPGLAQVWDVIGIIAPELRRCHPDIPFLLNPDFPDDKGSLWLGHIDIDAVPPDRLSGGATIAADEAGRFDVDPSRGLDERDCIP
jgi:hypothetical protein